MSKALAEASRLMPEIRLAQAVSEFEAELSTEQKSQLRTLKMKSLSSAPTPSDVMRVTAEIDLRVSKKFSSRVWGPRFTNFLQGVQQFAALGDIVVGGAQNLIAASVWSLVRMFLLSVANMSNYVEKISSVFMDIGRDSPRYQAMAVLYPQSAKLQTYLTEYFIVVVRLCRYLFRFGKLSTFQQFTSTLSDADLNTFQADLRKWADEIRSEIRLTEAQESSTFRGWSRIMFETASHQQKFAAKNRLLDICSTYDYETSWKQLRKTGNISLHTSFVDYREWRDSSHAFTLVFTGKLGSGKSVLLANIVDDLALWIGQDVPLVAYFFCKHDVPESLQARIILGSLVRQLLVTGSDLDTLSKISRDTYTTSDIDKIVEILLRSRLRGNRSYLLIDGLDECDNNERATLVYALQNIQKKLKVRICASFRLAPDRNLQSITDPLAARIITLPESNPYIEPFIEAELYRCLDQRLLTVGDSSLILHIRDALLKGSQGMFLWVTLQIQSLCSMGTDHDIREALANLPKDLSETFARILHKSGGSNPSLQAKTLQLILAAYRPLTTTDLREALSVTPGDAVWNPSKMLNDVYSALATCGCLITVDEEESTVRIIHDSVKQYLLEGSDDVKPPISSIGDAQRTLADTLVTYLGYNIFEDGFKTPQIVETSSTPRQLAMRLLKSRKQPAFDLSKAVAEARGPSSWRLGNAFHFLTYARTYWQNHILHVSGQKQPIYELTAKLIQNRASEIKELDASFGMHWRSAAERGNTRVLELLLHTGRLYYGSHTPLTWAIKRNDVDTVRLLIEASVDVNARDRIHLMPPPLLYAIDHDNIKVVELLLGTGKVDINATDHEGCTAIMRAVIQGNKSIVELLLRSGGFEVDAKNDAGMTALMMAALDAHQDVVKILLTIGKAEPSVENLEGQTALELATSKRREDVVELLNSCPCPS